MRATCPSCEAVYEVPDRLIGAGRRLRCTNCGHEWALVPPPAGERAAGARPAGARPVEGPPAETPPAGAAPSPPPSPFEETPLPPYDALAPRAAGAPPPARQMLRRPPQVIDPPLPPVDDNTGRSRRGDLALRAAWIGSVLLVVLALALLWAFREEIAGLWPPAARLVGSPSGGG
jgi:predicted Zn finger-like uncharacterized protein